MTFEEKRQQWLEKFLKSPRNKDAEQLAAYRLRAQERERQRLADLDLAKSVVKEAKYQALLAEQKQRRLIESLDKKQLNEYKSKYEKPRRTICSIQLHPHEKE